MEERVKCEGDEGDKTVGRGGGYGYGAGKSERGLMRENYMMR